MPQSSHGVAGVQGLALQDEISACRICAARFALTATAHAPRPVVWYSPNASILVSGQAPGARVHASGLPFDDASGDRLRDWMGIGREEFYNRDLLAVVPMAFCFPGYDAKGSDLPPPPICAATWRTRVMTALKRVRLTLLVGGAAQRWHLGNAPVAERVAAWRLHVAQGIYPLPHPSWRNTGWLKRNPWFESELLPELRTAVATVLAARDGS
ncbi:MAG: uracil-DNA glycosylase family protein [Paracoccaceae bacterium]